MVKLFLYHLLPVIRDSQEEAFYGVTKSALTFLAETLRIELVDKNIKVQVVHPGFVKTAMTDKNSSYAFFNGTKNCGK